MQGPQLVEIIFLEGDGNGRPRDANFVLPTKPAQPLIEAASTEEAD
jgi:hypothetical protein